MATRLSQSWMPGGCGWTLAIPVGLRGFMWTMETMSAPRAVTRLGESSELCHPGCGDVPQWQVETAHL